MNIEQTCKVTLSPSEVRAALTAYIAEKCRYKSNFKPFDDVLSYELLPTSNEIVVLWGEAPEEPVEEPAFSQTPEVVAAAITRIQARDAEIITAMAEAAQKRNAAQADPL